LAERDKLGFSSLKVPSFQSKEKWYLRWWMVAVWLFVFGPFALPALWKSKEIGPFWKWFWTVVVVLIAVVFAWLTWKIVVFIFKEVYALSTL